MATENKNVKRKFSATESAATALARQMFYAEDTRRLGLVLANGTDKEFWWAASRLADQTATYGAALLGIDGIAGITPEGGSSGGPGTLRSMVRGIASIVTGLSIDGNLSVGIGKLVSAYGLGAHGSSNMERISMFHGDGFADIASESSGSGTTRPMRLRVGDEGSYLTAIEILANGMVGIGGTANINYDLTVAKSKAGQTVGLKVMNEDSAADSDAEIRIEVQGSSSGEAKIQWDKNGLTYQMGTHKTDNKFVFEAGGADLGDGALIFEIDGGLLMHAELSIIGGLHFDDSHRVAGASGALTLSNGPTDVVVGNPAAYVAVRFNDLPGRYVFPVWELDEA